MSTKFAAVSFVLEMWSNLSKFVVLDIDGVILRGGSLIEGANRSIQRLIDHKIPYVFVTNGGGMTEAKKAKDLTKKVGINVLESQVVLSHTPFKGLKKDFGHSRVLVIGGEPRCVEVAKSYGFEKAVSIADLHAENKNIYPLRESSLRLEDNNTSTIKAVEAVLVFHDPVDWGLEMQIMSDLLSPTYSACVASTENRKRGHIPLYVSNADIVYTTEYPIPRFTQGAFASAFKHLYEAYHHQPLHINYCGKPYPVQYHYAQQMLTLEAQRLHKAHFEGVDDSFINPINAVYFGVGDNPKSDIRGANHAGSDWKSILVRTGVFNDRSIANDAEDPAVYVCEDIAAAVDVIINYKE